MKRFLVFLFLLPPCAIRAQVAVAPLTLPRAQFLSATGIPLAAGCVNFFATGTSTPQAIYADSGGVNQLPNPLTLDAAGEASVWLSNIGYDIVANTGVVGQPCSSQLGTQLWREVNKNPFSIINSGSNFIVASGTVDPSGVAGELAYRSDIPCFRGFTTIWDCFVELTLTQTVTNKIFDISANTLKTSSNVAGHYPRNNGTQYVDSTLIASDAQSTYVNEVVVGTTLNFLAQLVGIGTVNRPGIATTSGVIGICVSGCGMSGSAQIASSGVLSCSFDGATTANDYVQLSSTTGGQCHDAGATFPSNGNQVVGRVLSTNAGGGTYQIDFFTPEIRAPTNPAVQVVTAAAVDKTAQNLSIPITPLITPSANGFYRASCWIIITQAATTSSTLPTCGILFTDADSSTSFNLALTTTSAANSSGINGACNNASGGPPCAQWFYAKSGIAIQYQTSGYASVGATSMLYAVHLRLEGPF